MCKNITGATSIKRSFCTLRFTTILLLLVAFIETGCIPLRKDIQNSFHVNPVITQDYQKATEAHSGYDCSSMLNDNEMPCVINLDYYKFQGDTELALARLSNCEKAAATSTNSISTIKKMLSAQAFWEIKISITKGLVNEIDLLQHQIQTKIELIAKLKTKQSKAKPAEKSQLSTELEKENKELETIQKQLDAKNTALKTARAEEIQANQLFEASKADSQLTASIPNRPLVDDPESCRVMRNALEDEILYRSQQMCKKHLSDILATSSIINTDLGMSSIVFSTIGAVVGGVQAKSTMSALSGASSATQNLVNKEIYRDYIVPAILKAISSDRDRKLVEIKSDQTKDVINYSVSRAIYDAVDYHERCSFTHGLELLATDAEKRTPPRKEELEAQFDSNNNLITKLRESIHEKSSPIELALVEKTIERLRIENDTIVARINLMKRAQAPD